MPGGCLARKALSPSTLTQLLVEALENAWDCSTCQVYLSHLKSYLKFVRLHKLDPEPNETTLALFIVYMSQHIKPSSVESYLTGITHYLLTYYPEISKWHSAPIVHQTLCGCKKLYNTPVARKQALTLHDLTVITKHYFRSTLHDDLLFVVLLLTGFFGLLQLGELVYPEDKTLDNPRKIVQQKSLTLVASSFSFQLPYHKANKFFKGNTVLIKTNTTSNDPIHAMARYLISHDHSFPHCPDLWIRGNGEKPRRKWYLQRLQTFCSENVSGHSLHAGGATMLAEQSVWLDIIQALGVTTLRVNSGCNERQRLEGDKAKSKLVKRKEYRVLLRYL
jgi:hypothetical protein